MIKKFTIYNLQRGMTLLEVLVVITIFAVLGVLVTESVALALQGARKSASIVRTRENLDYSLGIIERQIRGASSITSPCPTPPDTPNPTTEIDYLDGNGNSSAFSCQQLGTVNSYIASGSSRLTSNTVKITDCSFMCSASSGSIPPLVTVNLTMQDASASGTQIATVSALTQIFLRNY
jgi:prepilin-type N-terminal cleavage/methylation domain-containing protein